jgi:hypothetical protein
MVGINIYQIIIWPVLMPADHSGRSIAVITGLNTAASMDVHLLCCVSSGVSNGLITLFRGVISDMFV